MKLIIAGDFCDRFRVSDLIKNHNYSYLFESTKHLIEQSDYSIVNFEFPIVTGYSNPIVKNGPNLKGRKESISAIKYAGFKCCSLANNHILDQGVDCGLETMQLIKYEGLDTVGFGFNEKDAASILYKNIGNSTVAIINCCEHEFSIATDYSAGANAINPIQQFYKIQEAKQNADFVIVIAHGGVEQYNLPTPRMQELYRFFINSGANIVVNHHQHCYSGYERYKDGLVFYGLGNFCFDNPLEKNGLWNYGYLLSLTLESKVKFEIHPYLQCSKNASVQLLKGSDRDLILSNICSLNEIINDHERLTQSYKSFIKQIDKRNYLVAFEPYRSSIARKLYLKGFLPSFISKQRIVQIQNFLTCESHNELLNQLFKTNG